MLAAMRVKSPFSQSALFAFSPGAGSLVGDMVSLLFVGSRLDLKATVGGAPHPPRRDPLTFNPTRPVQRRSGLRSGQSDGAQAVSNP
jgi:hypothetical protein